MSLGDPEYNPGGNFDTHNTEIYTGYPQQSGFIQYHSFCTDPHLFDF
jgi:hypothetical protein